MRRMRRIVQFLFVLTMLLIVVGAGVVVYWAYVRQPQLDGTASVEEVTAKVRVVRDDWGVPHIAAENEADAYFALGYVMAQDRLFQMDLARRVAGGMLAEVFGAKAVPVDSVVRSFRLRPKAEETLAKMAGAYPALKAVTDAFVAGINACIEREPLPFEFAVLAYTPEPFTPVDCLSVGALLPITFADGLREDPLATMIQQKHPELDIRLLFPGYDRETPVTVMESIEEARAAWEARADATSSSRLRETAALKTRSGDVASTAKLTPWLDVLHSISRCFGPALGSNSWVLSGSKTASGKPILANDPHISFTNPGIWYEAHLKYPGFENYGYHLPLIPFPLLGHNQDHAWALTMFANDDVDLYLEQFDPANPRRVMFQGEWTDVTEDQETIQVRFGNPVTATVRRTPHGPIVTDLLKAIAGYDGPDVSLSWIWQKLEYTDMEAFYGMGHAKTYDEFAAAVALVTSPGVNVSYADAGGTIAWWAAGRIPVRPKHVNSKTLLDGASGKDELLGYVPFEQNPHLKDPAWGYIVTANNLSTVNAVGEVSLLEGYWQPSDRAARIEYLLEQRDNWTVDALKAVQCDDTAPAAQAVVERAAALIEASKAPINALEQTALNTMKNWDHRHGPESAGAAVYQVYTDFLLREAVEDEMGETLFATYGTLADHWNFFKYLVTDATLPVWDNVSTEARETAEDIAVAALRRTAEFMANHCGAEASAWRWGALHTMEYKHPFGYAPVLGALVGRALNIGPFPAAGGAEIVNNMLYSKGHCNFSVVAGPSTRRLIDFNDIAHSLAILPTGNSGNFMSPHYADQAEMFIRGEYRMVRFTPAQIQENARHILEFVPSGGA